MDLQTENPQPAKKPKTDVVRPTTDVVCYKPYFMFWDVESTNKRPTEDDVISLGAVICEWEKVFVRPRTFHTFVFTRKLIDPGAEAVHHISQSDLEGQPTFPEAIELLKKWVLSILEPSDRVFKSGHNCFNFDDIMLFSNFKQHLLDYEQFLQDIHVFGFMDTLQVLKAWFKTKPVCEKPRNQVTGKPSFALGHCFETFCGKKLEGAHNALTDSMALFDIFTCERISKMFTLNTLFEHVRSKEKHLKALKKTVGVAFQCLTDRTKNETAEPDGDPVWDDDIDDESGEQMRLCLNCMEISKQSDHLQCFEMSRKCKTDL